MTKVGEWRSNAMHGYSHAELEDLDKFARLLEELA
jgi:hypothetical protein